MDTTVPAAKGFKQTDAWSTESLLALGLSDTRFTDVWVACWINAWRHLGEKQRYESLGYLVCNFIFL